jgi:hypothetical protein
MNSTVNELRGSLSGDYVKVLDETQQQVDHAIVG